MSGWRAATLEEDAAEERHRRQHVGLVDARHPAGAPLRAALPGQPERELTQPLGDAAADAQRVEHDVRTVATAHLARREEAFCRLADQDAVDARGAGIGERRRRAREHPDWAARRHTTRTDRENRGEVPPRCRRDSARRAVPSRPSRMASAASAPCSAAAGRASPVRRYSSAPGFEEGEAEREAADAFGDRLEQRDTRLHDLAADPVAGKDSYLKLAHTHP